MRLLIDIDVHSRELWNGHRDREREREREDKMFRVNDSVGTIGSSILSSALMLYDCFDSMYLFRVFSSLLMGLSKMSFVVVIELGIITKNTAPPNARGAECHVWVIVSSCVKRSGWT
jgi:hypothetical protein